MTKNTIYFTIFTKNISQCALNMPLYKGIYGFTNEMALNMGDYEN